LALRSSNSPRHIKHGRLQQVGLTTSTYEIIAANKTPTFYDSISTKAFLQAHRNQRNAILNVSPDPLATHRHSIHLILAGLPEHDSEVKLLQKEFNKKKMVQVLLSRNYTLKYWHLNVHQPALQAHIQGSRHDEKGNDLPAASFISPQEIPS
jgi:hypothetical protein